MKCISIRQPWAWLVAQGIKDVENRTWPAAHRGDTLIHAGQVFDGEGLAWVLQRFPHLRPVLPQQFELGGIVGLAQVVNCVATSSSAWFVGPWGFVLYGARPLRFVPLRGQLGFFDVAMSGALHAALHQPTAQQAEEAGQGRLL